MRALRLSLCELSGDEQSETTMEMTRRGFLQGMLAIGVAPAIITTPGLLMPVKKLWAPAKEFWLPFRGKPVYMWGWKIRFGKTSWPLGSISPA